MPSWFRTVACAGSLLVAVCVAAGHASQQEPPPDEPPPVEQQTPTFRTDINFVRVDAIISDEDGNPVMDLELADFEITEDGEPQTIETFKFVELDGGLMPGPDGPPRAIRSDWDEESEAARDDVRLFAIFLDDYHVRSNTGLAARRSIAQFVETELGPSDMVGLMYPLQPAASVRFTRNHEAIRRGIQQFVGRKYDYTPQNSFEENYAYYPTEVVERVRNQVSLTALEALASRMGGMKEGRKALILVSEGYTNSLPPQMRDQVSVMPGLGNPAAGNPMAGLGDPNEFRASALASFDLQVDLRDVYNAANRNNVAIYPVDPRGLAVGEFDVGDNINLRTSNDYLGSTVEVLRGLAAETDGRAIVNRNDLAQAMKQIVRDSSAYYLLGYSSTRAPTDGKFHQIKVRVTRPGVQVRARSGYWALTTVEAATAIVPSTPAAPKAVESALAAIAVPARRLIRTWLGSERGENGTTKVTFVWEPMSRTPGVAATPSEQPARVRITATGPDGTPYYRGGTTDTTRLLSFEAPPGELELRVVVEGADSEVLDSETRRLTVPDFTLPAVAFGTPAVFRVRTPREVQQVKTDPAAVPTARREFSRADRLLIRTHAYGAEAVAGGLTARLLDRLGQPMLDLPIARADTESMIELSLAGLAPGEYLVEIAPAGSGVKELVGFRVIGR